MAQISVECTLLGRGRPWVVLPLDIHTVCTAPAAVAPAVPMAGQWAAVGGLPGAFNRQRSVVQPDCDARMDIPSAVPALFLPHLSGLSVGGEGRGAESVDRSSVGCQFDSCLLLRNQGSGLVALVLSCGGLAHVPLDMLFLYSLPDALCALQVFLLVARQQSGGECDVRTGSPLVCHLSVPAVLLCHCGALHHAATGAVGESDTGDVPLCADFRSHLLTAGHQFHQRA